MNKIMVTNLKEGDKFTEPVYIESTNLLVPAGIAIRKKDIDRLISWGIDSVETKGDLVTAAAKSKSGKTPPASAPANAIANAPAPSAWGTNLTTQPSKPAKLIPRKEAHESDSSYTTYTELIAQMDDVCVNINSGITIEARSIDNISGRLLQAVRERRNSFITFILDGHIKGKNMAKNMVNTAILSAMIAMELNLPNHKILQIVTGALLHDVGMLSLPPEIVEKKGALSPAELQRIQSHTLYTFKFVNKELLYPEDVAVIVLQHHERWDGEGYPRRLAGTAIDLGARIVSVADAFEAMVSRKPYRNPLMGYQAMKNLLSDNLRRFDPNVIKAFIQTMGIYPIGSAVLLNNGALAQVVDVQASAPLRPVIRILADEFGKVFKRDEGEMIDLLVEKSLFIAKAVDPKDLPPEKS